MNAVEAGAVIGQLVQESGLPRPEAELLLCFVMGCERAYLLAHRDDAVHPFEADQALAWFARRRAGEPVAHIAAARFSPIMRGVVKFAQSGGLVLGICNGFQILCEAGLLPGALVRNAGLHFVCQPVWLRVEETDTPFTREIKKGQLLKLPIKHGEGCYFADPETLERLRKNRQVLLRYVDAKGKPSPNANPNGSLDNIAGICNANRNVFGLMPHPEDACDKLLGSDDGLKIFSSIAAAWADREAQHA
jgi:phosphoribosylformylglycinamidine synthase